MRELVDDVVDGVDGVLSERAGVWRRRCREIARVRLRQQLLSHFAHRRQVHIATRRRHRRLQWNMEADAVRKNSIFQTTRQGNKR